MKSQPSPAQLRELLTYQEESGALYWKARPFPAANAWNAKWAGKEAFTATSNGYRVGSVNGVNLRAHRVIWAMVHDEWPEDQIDHDDGIRANNRLANLFDVSNLQNHHNQSKSKANTSGVNGVSWDRQTGKWRAHIKVGYGLKNLGRYDTIEEASLARKAADQRFGFTERHGAALPGLCTA